MSARRARQTFITDQLAGVTEHADAQLRRGAHAIGLTDRVYDAVGRSALAQRFGQQLAELLHDGSVQLCDHIDAGAPSKMFWTPECPGRLWCHLCSLAYAFTRDEPGQSPGLCDGCGSPRIAGPLVLQAGPVTIFAAICAGCAGQMTGGS